MPGPVFATAADRSDILLAAQVDPLLGVYVANTFTAEGEGLLPLLLRQAVPPTEIAPDGNVDRLLYRLMATPCRSNDYLKQLRLLEDAFPSYGDWQDLKRHWGVFFNSEAREAVGDTVNLRDLFAAVGSTRRL
mmetsp:Transcript_49349/g.159326  ORF Transcript_49349/g.159326 Transcript_49349/m.159326 type:complete len:133 (+) Transcript_49349:201-599(+)